MDRPRRLPDRRTCTTSALGSRDSPHGVVFSLSGESRLLIRSHETRMFILFLEDCVSEMTNLPLNHLGMDRNGWSVNHPRIALLLLTERGAADFVARVTAATLETFRKSMVKDVPGYKGEPLTLADDVLDFVVDQTDWRGTATSGGWCGP